MSKLVKITIQTEQYKTADFLRELANRIEESETPDELISFKTPNGNADIVWPK